MHDQDGYPTEEELETIRGWTIQTYEDIHNWFDFIQSCWWHADWGWKEEDDVDCHFHKPIKRYKISTGGWSGNEEIIDVMSTNAIWQITWVQSRRGGHFMFEVKMEGKDG